MGNRLAEIFFYAGHSQVYQFLNLRICRDPFHITDHIAVYGKEFTVFYVEIHFSDAVAEAFRLVYIGRIVSDQDALSFVDDGVGMAVNENTKVLHFIGQLPGVGVIGRSTGSFFPHPSGMADADDDVCAFRTEFIHACLCICDGAGAVQFHIQSTAAGGKAEETDHSAFVCCKGCGVRISRRITRQVFHFQGRQVQFSVFISGYFIVQFVKEFVTDLCFIIFRIFFQGKAFILGLHIGAQGL